MSYKNKKAVATLQVDQPCSSFPRSFAVRGACHFARAWVVPYTTRNPACDQACGQGGAK